MDYDFIELKSYKLSDISDPKSLVIFITMKHYNSQQCWLDKVTLQPRKLRDSRMKMSSIAKIVKCSHRNTFFCTNNIKTLRAIADSLLFSYKLCLEEGLPKGIMGGHGHVNSTWECHRGNLRLCIFLTTSWFGLNFASNKSLEYMHFHYSHPLQDRNLCIGSLRVVQQGGHLSCHLFEL